MAWSRAGPGVALRVGMSAPPPRIVTSTSSRSPYLVPLGALAAAVLAGALAIVPLPGAVEFRPLVKAQHVATLPAWQVRANGIALAWAMPPRASAKVLGVWPHLAALGLGAAACGVVSAARGRPVREGGRGVWAATLVACAAAGAGAMTLVWDPAHDLVPGASKAFSAVVLALITLAWTAANVAIGKVTGLAGAVVALAALGAGQVFFIAQLVAMQRPGSPPMELCHVPFIEDVLGLTITLAGGLWLVRRYRLGEVDLTGPLAACPTPAEVALLPCAAWTGIGGGVWLSVQITRRSLPGFVDLGWLVESGWPWLITRTTLAALSVAGLAWLLARRERRDRALD